MFGTALAIERSIFLIGQLAIHGRDILLEVLDLEVPGMGSITGLRLSSHASAIWPGVAL